MADETTKNDQRLYQEMVGSRSRVENLLQKIADYLMPNNEDILTFQPEGTSRRNQVFDTTGEWALHQFANFLHSVMMPEGRPWPRLRVTDDKLAGRRDVKEFLDFASTDIQKTLNASNFYPVSFATILDTIGLGPGFLYMESRLKPADEMGNMFDRMVFHPMPVGTTWFMRNSDGEVDTIARMFFMRADTAAFRYRNDGPSEKLQKIVSKKAHQQTALIQLIKPDYGNEMGEFVSRTYFLGEAPTYMTRAIMSDWELLRERRLEEFPVAAPQWAVTAGHSWPYGLGHLAIGDVLEANAMRKRELEALEIDSGPPARVGAGALVGDLGLISNGIMEMTSGKFNEFELIRSGADYNAINHRLSELTQNIMRTFFVDQLRLPDDLSRATATEIEARRQDAANSLGSTFSKIQRELPRKVVEFVFRTKVRLGAYPNMPESLDGSEFEVGFESPMATSQRMAAIRPALEWLTLAQNVAKGTQDPEVLSMVNWEVVLRDVGDASGVPAKYFRDHREKQQRVEQIQRLQQLQLLQQGAETSANVLDKVPELKQQLGLTGGGG